jgi:hypothetical protein
MDYSDMSLTNNAGNYFGIFSMLCLIAAMLHSNWYDKQQILKNDDL